MSRTANPVRGETSLVIGERPYVLRPSFEALIAAEEELGSLFALVERAAEGALTIVQMTALLWHCLPADDRPDREELGRALLAMGLIEAAKPVRSVFAQVLKGSR